jgi:hypothetical protein
MCPRWLDEYAASAGIDTSEVEGPDNRALFEAMDASAGARNPLAYFRTILPSLVEKQRAESRAVDATVEIVNDPWEA